MAETVALSGAHLDELIAASGETPVVRERVENEPAAHELDIEVETTVVMNGARRSSHDTTSSGSYNALAYTVPPRAVAAPPREPSIGRRGNSVFLAVAGLLFGVLVTTSLTSPRAHAGRELAPKAQKHERVVETTPLSKSMHQKAPTKRTCKAVAGAAVGAGVGTAVRSSAGTTIKVAPPRANEATDDSQLVEDRQLVQAAQLERSL